VLLALVAVVGCHQSVTLSVERVEEKNNLFLVQQGINTFLEKSFSIGVKPTILFRVLTQVRRAKN
jgi:hypothetical protein